MQSNPQLDLALRFLESTGIHLFLTGKAGTGKTTFLRNLRAHSPKRMIVVAPTGVAAINAGGVTIHSFFQLPFGPYLPAMQQESNNRLKMQFSKEKINIIRSLDLLVIDEISMVRADLLDAINDVLQRYRDRNKPFGGVQLLMIGDLQQLAPVVKPAEWELIHSHYSSPYFFDSKALRSTEYITLELKHIYRQNDLEFIEILNRVRTNRLDAQTLSTLNSRYIPDFAPDESQGYITLTSHNEAARRINEQKMAQLPSPTYEFDCQIEGDFPEDRYPTDAQLCLKLGAQVMFVKNDISGAQRYFNGKIGRVVNLGEESIEVELDDQPEPIEVEIAEWTNAKYTIDTQTQEITEQIDGVFRQYPLKAAWAITIHKSQGLTFDRAIIDAADSFSHGQVYVALSRCRSFEGLVLRTPLTPHAIINDSLVSNFSEVAARNQPDEQVLSEQTKRYKERLLCDLFDFEPLQRNIRWMQRVVREHLTTLYPLLAQQWSDLQPAFERDILAVGVKFQHQLQQLIATAQPESQLTERIRKAQSYFREQCERLLQPLAAQNLDPIDNKEAKKQVGNAFKEFRTALRIKCALLDLDFEGGFSIHDYLEVRAKATLEEPKIKKERVEKAAKIPEPEAPQDIENPELFEHLRAWRKEKCDEAHVSAFVILHQKPLITLCNTRPQTHAELQAIKGIGKQFLTKYGDEVLDLIAAWNARHAEA